MSANLQKNGHAAIPAGLFTGIEAFYYNGEKWVIYDGVRYRYNDAPTKVKSLIQSAFMRDKASHAYMLKHGISKVSDVFDVWYRCVVGGIDHVADISGTRLTPDAFNNLCEETNCQHRGRLCGATAGLRSWELETIEHLKKGSTMEQVSLQVHLSLPAIKSRVAKLQEKLQAENTVAMIARCVEMGV